MTYPLTNLFAPTIIKSGGLETSIMINTLRLTASVCEAWTDGDVSGRSLQWVSAIARQRND
jgi:hypothetical protein